MTNHREILRLSSLGLNKTQIAQSVGCSRTIVIHVLNIAEEKGISSPLPSDLSGRKLSELLFSSTKAKPKYKMPDYEYVGKELRKKRRNFNIALAGVLRAVPQKRRAAIPADAVQKALPQLCCKNN